MGEQLQNISWIVRHELCVGCGICQDICPKKAIQIKSVNGLFNPVVNENICINNKGCYRCRTVCPGGGVKLVELSKNAFGTEEEIKRDQYIGQYISCYSGYSNDYNLRYYGASGGMVSQFLIYLLEEGYIQGAVVTRFSKEKEFWVDTFVAKNRKEILSAKSSKYCPVTMAGLSTQLKQLEGKYAIVGLPCHLHGLRKLAEIDKKFSEKIFAFIGLYCSCGRNFSLTEYVFKSRGIDLEDVDFFTYRQESGMGKMLAIGKQNEKDFKMNIPFQDYYLTLRSYFNVRRCMHCVDHFAELGDICFGDIHTGKYIDDKIGISSMVTRNKCMDDILQNMAKEGVVTICPVSKEELLNSQKYVKTKKHLNPSYMKIDHLLGKEIPDYDVVFQAMPICKVFKSYIVKIVQMFIGRHKKLHWLVKLMSKDMKNWK